MKFSISFIFLFFCSTLIAQDAITYQTPPKEIADLALAKPTPSVSFDDNGKWMLIMDRSALPSVEELAQPEFRIAGLRINPSIFAASRGNYFTALMLKEVNGKTEYPISGLPANLKAANVQWSPAENKIAFTNNTVTGIDLYSIDLKTRFAKKINKTALNTLLGSAFEWIDNNTLIYKAIVKPASMAPVKPLAPKGPVVQQSLGKVAASVTYQDLIKTPYDESLFEFYATIQLVKNVNGIETKIGKPFICNSFDPSPDNKYLLIERIDKPFSYLVTVNGFNSSMLITDMNGKEIKLLAKLPSSELSPTGYDNVLNAPRSFNWVTTDAAKIIWIEPQDSGLIKKKVDFHDAVFALNAPFTASPAIIAKTALRINRVAAVSSDLYFVYESSRAKHRQKLSKLQPSTTALTELYDRSTDDAYNDPGTPVTDKNNFGKNSIKLLNGSLVLMRGNGASAKGDLPFLNSFNINTKETKTLWRCEEPFYETVAAIIDFEKMQIITNKQSQTDQPNYYWRDIATGKSTSITNFPDPQPGLRGIIKQKINYKRKDGVDLTADLYLPKNYDAAKDGRLPVFMWAYPREFKSSSDAAQVRGSKYTFTRVSTGSAIFWATQGYAVMDNTEFPIVGEGDKQPNDNFIEQLVMNAEAAINKIAEMGIGDTSRMAVGGHSYGAFMTSNLLAHTKLFKAGISRSGAYNRTLTPFGFQNEERTYWQAPEVYFKMSPFSYANQITTPLLLIHGEADNNPGTFPIQSERLFNALKGHGGTIRYVQLPFESHGYASKENILHMLWEMTEWLNKYVKNASK